MSRHPFRPAPLIIASVLLFILHSSLAHAQARRTNLAAANVPTPQSMLGFAPGDDKSIADWAQIRAYFARLAAASDRVKVATIGQSTEGRPLIVAYISAPENIRNLARYQEMQRKLADPRLVHDDAERERLIHDGKVVVAVSCSIHSTEIVASQMSMRLAYDLASAQDEETRQILQNVILLLIPSPNPDGIQIVADWYRKTLGTPYEGSDPPEIYHHYAGHDDNRDWFMLNLVETQAITKLFWHDWFPEVVYDIHQQGQTGSRFFVPPFFDPPNPNIAPLLLREVGLVGHKIAAYEEAAGMQGVITNALYDTWWHGGFRTAPYYHNSVGILTEAASAKVMTPLPVTKEQLERSSTRGMDSALPKFPTTNFPDPWPGGKWRPRDIMKLELIAVHSVLSLASNYRGRYLRNFYALGRNALNSEAGSLAYLIEAGQGKDENVAKLVGALIAQGVEVQRLEHELHVRDYEQILAGGQPPTREAPASSYIVFLAQPYASNVRALFERQVYPNRLTASGEAERPYDVAGWTLPMQMGLEAPLVYITEPTAQRRLTLIRDENDVRRDLGLPLKQGPRSPIANPITRPIKLALYKSWTASMDEGWTRYVFDTFNVPYQTLRDKDVRAGNLRAQYDVIVLPSMRMREIVEGNAAGRYPVEFTGGIGSEGVEALRRFVEAGGTLVCFDASSELAIKQFKLPLRNVLEGLKSSDFYCPGSILRLTVDPQQPLAHGFGRDVDAYFINSSAFEVSGGSGGRVHVIARYADKDVLRSGWLLGEKFVAGKIALTEVSMGQGRVVLFGFRPQHRGQTWGTFQFIWNAILDSGQA
jgi:Zinc carboxypeptidase